MDAEVKQKNTLKQKFLDLIPRIDKFMCCLDLKLGVILTSVILFVLIITYITTSVIEQKDKKTKEYLIFSLFLPIGNIAMLILAIVGVVKKKTNLLKSAFDWFIIAPIFWLVFSIIDALMSFWIS